MRYTFAALLFLFSAHASALTVAVTANSDGADKPIITGATNLPDDIDLMITLRRNESHYMAQDKVKVKGGAFRAGPFTQKGAGLNPGTYTLEVSMPIAAVQPPPTWPVIGNDGANLQGPLAKRSKFGGKVVEYKTSLKIGGGPSAEKDKLTRAQSEMDDHSWWLQSCKDTCNMAQNIARKQSEAFDSERCYYKCVADEPKKK